MIGVKLIRMYSAEMSWACLISPIVYPFRTYESYLSPN